MTIVKSYTVKSENIDDSSVQKIVDSFKNCSVGLNMKNVKSINSNYFMNCVLSNKFKLYNLNSDVLAYLSLTIKDGRLKSYINFEDLKLDVRELTRRRFRILN